jgi:hypothetical protein
MKRSQQIGSEIAPSEEEDTLALIMRCPKCDTQRAFRVTDSFAMAVTRKSSGCQYNASCTICDYRLEIQLVWTRRHLGVGSREDNLQAGCVSGG